MNDYYKQVEKLDKLIVLANPQKKDLERLRSIIKKDEKLEIYFYENNNNFKWLNLLNSNDEFLTLEEDAVVNFSKAKFLNKAIEKNPEEVLDIIGSVEIENPFLRGEVLKSLLKVEPSKSVQLTWLILKYLNFSKELDLYNISQVATELVVKFADDYVNESFAIAEKLLEVVPSKEEGSNFAEMQTYYYEEFLSKKYSKLWKKEAFRAFKILFIKLKDHLEKIKEQEGYDASSFLASDNFKNIDEIEKADLFGGKIELITLAGLRDIGKEVLSKQPEKTDRLFGLVEKSDFKIFKHLEIYLLRFTRIGEQNERIKKTLMNDKFIDESSFYNEYILLIKNKINEFDEAVTEQILSMVNSMMEKVSLWAQEWVKKNPENKESKDFDIKKHKAGRLAKWLYPLRELDVFSKMYEENKSESNLAEEKLKPEPKRPRAEFISGCEGSVISFDEMVKLKPETAFEELKKPENWKYAGGRWRQDKEGDAISQVFEKVVEQRVDDYIVIEPNKILELKPIFVDRYVNGLVNACSKNEEKLKKNWLRILRLGLCLHEAKGNDNEYDWTFRNILSIIGDALEAKELKDELINKYFDELWVFIELLCKHPEKDVKEDDYDPHQESINCVQGIAFELAIQFSLVCRNIAGEKWEKELSSKLIGVLDYLLGNVKLNKIRCILGVWFPQIHLLANEWVGNNIDDIFNEKDYADWNVVWGSYVNWSRAYKDTFIYLAEIGKYDFAIENIDKEDKYKRSKVPAKGVIEHLMIAFFNEWISYDNSLLQKFYSTATVTMKAQAANFLSGGFKALKEEPKDGIVSRLKEFWDVRLQACETDSSLKDEIVKFTNWVDETPFDKKETLELLYRTLCLTNGEVGKLNSNVRVINGICEIAEGNELLALKCLNKIKKDQDFGYGSSLFKDKFIELLEKIADNFAEVKEIRKEALMLVNEIGRLQTFDLKLIYKKLVLR
ncbi:MAG: hypothetical protein KAS96_00765 [Planctomycetes bacterium]|nr:hypothetical protein [Planctomycetota bacterium]